MLFEWDDAKHAHNQRETKFGFDFAALIFQADTITWPDERLDYGESRMRAIGEVDGLVLHVVFSDRGHIRRIISARAANKKERSRWYASQ